MIRSEALAITGCILLGCLSQAVAQEATVEEAGRTFPSQIVVHKGDAEYQLTATGTALRKKFVFKVYAMAHYMEVAEFPDEAAALEAARSGKHPCQITMEFMRDVSTDKIQDAYREGFEKNATEDDFEELEPLVTLFVSFFDDVQKGDKIVLQRFPDGTVRTFVNDDEKDTLTDGLFAAVLWNIWFGEHSPVDRKKLVKLTYHDKD